MKNLISVVCVQKFKGIKLKKTRKNILSRIDINAGFDSSQYHRQDFHLNRKIRPMIDFDIDKIFHRQLQQ